MSLFGKLVVLVKDYLLNGFVISGFEVTITMVSCYACVLVIFILAHLILLHCSCLYGGIITHVIG